jgi:fructose-1,6-bisphosphatase/inositol monophosphatase family enzyme
MVREAGGTITDFEGRPFALDTRRILASNDRLHPEMMSILAGAATRPA